MFGKPRRDTMRNSARCRACGAGTCRCKAIAANDLRQAKAKKAPHVCGAHIARTGATCRKTVAHGERCSH